MNHIKYYDLTNLNEMLGGDKKAILQMIKIFLVSTPETLNDLNKCHEKNDLSGVSKLAHKLKSSIDIFAIGELKQEIRRIETTTRDRFSLDELPELIQKLNNILDAAIEQISEYKEELQKEFKDETDSL
ncbi:MAG: Hpt domain-containing protein [Bacteroidales bacterium]|nr:Hpt domain-containing protein [Bacteroidales bacterium]